MSWDTLTRIIRERNFSMSVRSEAVAKYHRVSEP